MTSERKSRALIAPLAELTSEQCLRVLSAIRDRTQDEGDCLLWTGAHSRGQGSNRPQPALWLDGKTMPLRRLAYVAYGRELFAHWRVSTTCGNDSCLCKEHLKRKTHSESLMGHKKSFITRAKIAARKQAASPLDWDKVRDIRSSDASMRSLAAQYGVHEDTISKVRNYQSWREIGGVFSGLVART